MTTSTAEGADGPEARPLPRRTLRSAARVLPIGALALAALLALPALASADEACPPAGGGDLPPLAEGADGETFRFVGRGWGHGIGMSQWGAQGAALLGCSYVDILTTYYPGVQVAAGTLPEGIRVGLMPNQPGGARPAEVRVAAVAGDVPWHFGGSHVATQPQGHTWAVRVQDNGSYRLVRLTGDGGEQERWRGGGRSARLRADLGHDPSRRVRVVEKNTHYARGSLEFNSGGLSGAQMQVSVVLPSIEHYLYGLREVPASWDVDALKAQAVVGRSYAVDRRQSGFRSGCDCHLFDSVYDQVYRGYDHEAAAPPWVSAVDETRGETIRYGGSVAVGFYASSHGGHSETNYFVWGGTPLGYLQPVDDSRWEAASDNPNLAWHADFSPAELGQRLGVGIALDVRLPEPKGAAGRIGDPDRGAGGFVVVGSERTATFSGNEIRNRLNLRSTLFDLANVPACMPPEGAEYGDLVDRAGGANRYATAAQLSARGWEAGDADTVLIAPGRDFPDALAGGALADALDAPLLLTRSSRLPEEVVSELERLAPERALLLGGARAIPPAVEDAVADLVDAVQRVSGSDRFATAAAIADLVGPGTDGTVILALGRHADASRDSWPDALAAGALTAADGHAPVLLARSDALPQATRDALDRLDATHVRLVGGTVAVSAAVQAELEALGLDVERLAGPNRYATSAAVVAAALSGAEEADGLLFATASDFPDGLAAGALAARQAAPLLLVPDCDLGSRAVTAETVEAHADRLEHGLVLGGHRAVGERIRWQLEELLR